MASAAISAYGTLLQLGDGGSPENFTTIAEVRDITGPQLTRNSIDVTNHSSANGFEEFVLGIKKSGQVSFEVNFVPTAATQNGTTGLWAEYQNATKANYKMIFPSSYGTLSFAAFCDGIEPHAPVNGALTAKITLKVTGPVTLS